MLAAPRAPSPSRLRLRPAPASMATSLLTVGASTGRDLTRTAERDFSLFTQSPDTHWAPKY
jgi:hypothetical protein